MSLHFLIGFCICAPLFIASCGSKSNASEKLEDAFKPAPESKKCGAEGSFVANLVPEKWVGYCNQSVKNVSFSDACVAHDACYDTFGAPKENCDQEFLKNLEAACGNAYSEPTCGKSKDLCVGVSQQYYSTVKDRGGEAYASAQKAAQPTPSP